MKKHPSSVIASCVIIILKPSGSHVDTSSRAATPVFYTLYIIYIYNSNNDADDSGQQGQGFPARHPLCRFPFFLFNDATSRSGSRHFPITVERASNLCPTRADIHALCPTQAPSFSFQISNTGAFL